jgi:hypothetical protein
MSVLCSDMCTYTCNVCGKVFTQRRIKKHLEREHKKSPTKLNYQTARLVYYRSLLILAIYGFLQKKIFYVFRN